MPVWSRVEQGWDPELLQGGVQRVVPDVVGYKGCSRFATWPGTSLPQPDRVLADRRIEGDGLLDWGRDHRLDLGDQSAQREHRHRRDGLLRGARGRSAALVGRLL